MMSVELFTQDGALWAMERDADGRATLTMVESLEPATVQEDRHDANDA